MRNVLTLSYPASFWTAKWRDALPCGNGEIGASVYGAIHDETILINHESLWADIIKNPLPDISGELPKLRSMMRAGKILESQELLGDALKEKGYKTSVASPLPLGDVRIKTPVRNPFRDYSRSIDMESGEITVTWRDGDIVFTRHVFVSRADNAVVIRISASVPDGLDGTHVRLCVHDLSNAHKPFGLGKEPVPGNVASEADGDFITYAADYAGVRDFGMAGIAVCDSGEVTASGQGIALNKGTCVTVILKTFTNGDRNDDIPRLKRELKALKSEFSDSSSLYDALLERHHALHSALFLSASFDLGGGEQRQWHTNEELLLESFRGNISDELTEKLWSFGRYLLISGSREEGQPCPLLGLWHGDYRAFWSFHMLNENIQMIYWQALSGNMPRLLLAVFDYYESMLDDFRQNAKNLFGCRGIYIPAVTTPGAGTIQCTPSHILNWTAGAGWLCQHYRNYALYTGDDDFLKNRALPFLRETALFYEDFFIVDESGYYASIPSVSPENSPGNFCGADFEGPEVMMNATMDFAIAKEVLTNLLEDSKRLGVYPDEWKKWERMLGLIPPYQLTEYGGIREWMHPFFEENNHHRHMSHLYPLFPGTEVTQESQPELFEAFKRAVKERLKVGLTSQTSWSQAHMACVYARTGEGASAYECLCNIMRVFVMNNLFTVHNDWRGMGIGMDMEVAPFQIDANMGITAAINEMLLFSKDDCVKVLPALPPEWPRGRVTGLAAMHGVIVDIEWDMERGYMKAEFSAKTDRVVDVVLPGCFACADGAAKRVHVMPGNRATLEARA